VLAVVEDRGVPISREAFASAAAAAPSLAGAGVEGAGQAPVAADPLLLGVVEDTAAEVEEDESGVVASLMEGEARGHLYRRAASLGMSAGEAGRKERGQPGAASGGSRAAGSGLDGRKQQQQEEQRPKGQQKQNQQQQEQEQEQEAGSSATAPSAPPLLAASASTGAELPPLPVVAPKPAFVAVGTPSSQLATARPAFVSVSGATLPPRTAATLLEAAAAPAQQAVSQPNGAAAVAPASNKAIKTSSAAPLSLGNTGRKRKKANASSQRQQQQQQDAAATAAAQAPKSWEDWLAPLGAAAPMAALSAQPKQLQHGKRRKGR
jgi:hypothetical protein